jgi:hypothetical protein
MNCVSVPVHYDGMSSGGYHFLIVGTAEDSTEAAGVRSPPSAGPVQGLDFMDGISSRSQRVSRA